MADYTLSFHPEKHIDGFTAVDGTVRFYNFVRAILPKTGFLLSTLFGRFPFLENRSPTAPTKGRFSLRRSSSVRRSCRTRSLEQ